MVLGFLVGVLFSALLIGLCVAFSSQNEEETTNHQESGRCYECGYRGSGEHSCEAHREWTYENFGYRRYGGFTEVGKARPLDDDANLNAGALDPTTDDE